MSREYVNNDYQLKVSEILAQLWGYKRFLYFPTTDTTKTIKPIYDGLKAVDYRFQSKSVLGTPIIMPLKMQISPKGQPVEFFAFPNEPIIEIKGTKKIVETEIDGQDGTFKELYNLGDYSITIRGVAVNEDINDESHPEDIVRSLRQVYELKHHVEVVNPLFTLFNIKYLTLTEFNLPVIEGAPGMQPYEFSALSDKDFDLELKSLAQL